ncbi:MAG: hypothetical protein OEQ53_17640 [Saprospiraceae bacterium]|nr:hypothetical protein [Saprospiraceae bacterium]
MISLVFTFYSYLRFKDRHPGYWVDIKLSNSSQGPITAGFAKTHINPEAYDTWVDVNQDARYRENDGDTFLDQNENGRFDPIWIAGFHNQRPAQGLHDTLWARAIVISQGDIAIGLVAIDAIGFGSDEIISIRKEVQKTLDLDYLIVSSSHSHQTPDLIGMWGPNDYKKGVDAAYLELVKAQIETAVNQAYDQQVEATFRFAEDSNVAASLVEDSRRPIVLDAGLRVLEAIETSSGKSLGTLIGWANHPETLWSDNLLLSSDFPHYLRLGVEKGVPGIDSLAVAGRGGVAIFLNGAIGGLMTTSPRFAIPSIDSDTSFLVPSFEKARAQGYHLASAVLHLLNPPKVDTINDASLSLVARSTLVPMKNRLFRLGAWLGVLDRGMAGWFTLRTEVAYWQLGEIGFLHVPGEIYPEIINGGIESPPGQDFDIDPVEIPPLRTLLPCTSAFVVGLSNDMIGYIIPKSEWDEHPPYIYHSHDAPYGEINSLGPETGPIIHSTIFRMIEDYKTTAPSIKVRESL